MAVRRIPETGLITHQLLPLKLKLAVIGGLFLAINAAPAMVGRDYHLEFSLIATVAELLILAAATKSWRMLCWFPSWVRPRWMVNLNGEWRGTVHSQWKAKPEDPPLPPIPVAVTIRQNWMKFSVSMKTDNMESYSHGPHIIWHPDEDELRVQYFYETDPMAAVRATNPKPAAHT